jgi:hypothetical protein
MASFPRPEEGIVLTPSSSAPTRRSRRFYRRAGRRVLLDGEPTIIALANS